MDRPCKRKPYQHEIVLWHLQRYGTIMNREAWERYRLPGAYGGVRRLRKRGYLIESVPIRCPGWGGRPTSFAMYVYRGRR